MQFFCDLSGDDLMWIPCDGYGLQFERIIPSKPSSKNGDDCVEFVYGYDSQSDVILKMPILFTLNVENYFTVGCRTSSRRNYHLIRGIKVVAEGRRTTMFLIAEVF